MLGGHPTVFLSCSEKFKEQVARPIRARLAEQGVRGIIVSDEPALPRTSEDPGSKIDSYLDASVAFVALCTPDDELADGTVQCRPNIIDELSRARSRPNLRHRIQVYKAPSVRLHSNINPTYEPLVIQEPRAVAENIIAQLQAWDVLGRESRPELPPAVEPPATVSQMIDGLQLGDHDDATRRAYALLRRFSRQAQSAAVDQLRVFLVDSRPEGGDQVHRAGSVLEAVNRLDPSLVSAELIEELVNCADFTVRSTAASMLWDRAKVAPQEVPLGLLGRLALPSTEDWYVQAPAMAAIKQLLLCRSSARIVFDRLAASGNSEDRHAVATALLDVACVDPTAVPHDLVQRLAGDGDQLVADKASEALDLIGDRPADWRDPRSPFGL